MSTFYPGNNSVLFLLFIECDALKNKTEIFPVKKTRSFFIYKFIILKPNIEIFNFSTHIIPLKISLQSFCDTFFLTICLHNTSPKSHSRLRLAKWDCCIVVCGRQISSDYVCM